MLIPTVAILHAVDTSASNTATSHNETSDDNAMTHGELDDASDNAADTD